jgi:hypothetical protein
MVRPDQVVTAFVTAPFITFDVVAEQIGVLPDQRSSCWEPCTAILCRSGKFAILTMRDEK